MSKDKSMKKHPFFLTCLIALMIVVSSACSTTSASPQQPTLTQPVIASPTLTQTESPPTETPTVAPTSTSTDLPTHTPTVTETASPSPLPTDTPTQTPQPIVNYGMNKYLILLGSGGPDGCGDTVVPVMIGILPTGDVREDVKTALNNLFGPRVQYEGNLYNATYQSRLRVESIDFKKSTGQMKVYLAGKFVKPKSDCDKKRYHAQVWETVYQFPEIKRVDLYIGQYLLGDLLVVGDN